MHGCCIESVPGRERDPPAGAAAGGGGDEQEVRLPLQPERRHAAGRQQDSRGLLRHPDHPRAGVP
eukprot:763456-Pyramimonas_sp.AAC.1